MLEILASHLQTPISNLIISLKQVIFDDRIIIFTSLRFAPASALLIQFLSRVQSPEPESP